MNFECNGKIYSLPLAKPAEVGSSYSYEEYELIKDGLIEDVAFLFLDSPDYLMCDMQGEDYKSWDRQRMCIATGDTACRLWQMLCEVGVATKQLYRAAEFEPDGFLALTLEHAREVERLQAIDLDNKLAKTRGKSREQLEAEEAVGNGKGMIVAGGKTN